MISGQSLEIAKPVGVTGANGFVGAALIRHLADLGVAAIALSRSKPDPVSSANAWRRLPDLDGNADFSTAVQGLDCVVHCAARVHVMKDRAPDPLAAFRTVNCEATLSLARAAALAGIKRFVFVSSIKVNGDETEPGKPYHPSDTPQPVGPYGQSKAEAEAGLRALCEETGMELAIVRPVLVYGSGVKANFAAMARLAGRGLPLPLASTRNSRSFVYIENLADLLAKLATGELPAQTYLASDGTPIATSGLLHEMAEAQGRKARLFPIPRTIARIAARLSGRTGIYSRLFGSLETDIEHLRQVGWQPPFDLQEGLRRTFTPPLND